MGTELLEAAISFGWLQWCAVFFNLAYVVLAARQNIWCWVFGGIGVTLLFFVYVDARLFSDATLHVFYLAMSIYGYVQWKKVRANQVLSIRTGTWQRHLIYFGLGIVTTLLLGRFWQFFDAALPYVDAATTAFSIIATFLVAQRYLENWLYWIVIDLVCIWVYIERELYLLALLFAIYAVLAIWGFFNGDTNRSPSLLPEYLGDEGEPTSP